jgi:hypothetical protein
VVAGRNGSESKRGSTIASEPGTKLEPTKRASACFCPSSPHSAIGSADRPGDRTASAIARSPQASSSAISAPVTALRSPPPPAPSGRALATSPSSWAAVSTFSGSFALSSHSRATGRISFWANCRTVSITSCCSSVGWKSIMLRPSR